ncbi:hypothetical protein BC936DRAFT_140299 [Jimgerdemannia flammicorona]|uniref:Uncharacterized protein n=1 Tax=Jimgerdemannia flammicorona TaxID=994334 RepID=A0A433AVI8_9FUNG|nr:hypothetical protein BC936DRAFT_140299 [Jimgerdemannia flammicorona]
MSTPFENQLPREWFEIANNAKSWTIYPTGGHFASLEEPELLVSDIRRSFGRGLKENWIKL